MKRKQVEFPFSSPARLFDAEERCLFGVSVHEVCGHGLTAELIGGEFVGFEVHLDGMGSATTVSPYDATVLDRCTVLMGGVVSTLVVGFLLLLAVPRITGFWARTRRRVASFRIAGIAHAVREVPELLRVGTRLR